MSTLLKGTAHSFDSRGFLKVVFPDGQWAFIELLGGVVSIGDQIVGNLHGLGGERLYNATTGTYFEAFIQDYS